ncbi:MAG: DUF998 domain-containing protein [Thermoplasmata archaeon]|nr:DUF998 domain-containing protein [Thermoplasmata archaeon]MCI4370494.1 DUF998 domain-containing protein [Thermoplasmata archaeon]
MTTFGPLVRRSARLGGAILAFGSIQFVAAMVVVQLYYPGYSDSGNAVSDLGSSMSPWAWLFNDSIRVLGLAAILGALLIRSAFASKSTTHLGLGALVVGGLGAIGVGTFPENTTWPVAGIHGVVALLTFLGSAVALLLLALAMSRDTRWQGLRAYSFLSGILTLLAVGLYATDRYLGLGPGGMERLIIAPILLWGVVVGIHLARLQVYVPASSPSGTAT